MKSALIIIAVFFLARPVLPVLDYIINYDYIAAELCENKAKPEMHCNGKCHLKKELAKASDSEKPLSQKKSQASETEVLFFQDTVSFNPQTKVSIITSNIFIYTNLYSYQEGYSHFHPPLVIS
ncbi:hypothetical protein LRS05_14425 [Flavobacterium sp. J372]|uniref:hypothetical protein n=1 Tax=Flavobacterium sp. J372 TaxID=2898436 RepID=UPI002150C88E|nr:hypothetical protein [Flavobacterium sp. J372]MCR5863242.1 hypothetical protein [Flavobacterium sp. J372]